MYMNTLMDYKVTSETFVLLLDNNTWDPRNLAFGSQRQRASQPPLQLGMAT